MRVWCMGYIHARWQDSLKGSKHTLPGAAIIEGPHWQCTGSCAQRLPAALNFVLTLSSTGACKQELESTWQP